ncbi:hypothetical protein CEXT_634361 [Caerostris extrusa]|uniref:Uncharacterized protein n=1 Tax=Caerostris extrusa TaxID=172846 RepID=A0AAV4QT34_CAEEX|nr:hypothetical protein CEXT_634361 [Caerostris extrusa]
MYIVSKVCFAGLEERKRENNPLRRVSGQAAAEKSFLFQTYLCDENVILHAAESSNTDLLEKSSSSKDFSSVFDAIHRTAEATVSPSLSQAHFKQKDHILKI